MEEDSSNDEEALDTLDQLFGVCASITEKALSMPTLAEPGTMGKTRDDANSEDVDLRREEQISRWMDQQILDYESRLYRMNADGNVPRNPVSSVELWQQLTDDSARIEQERLLLTRILDSRVANDCEASQADDMELRREVQGAIQRQATALLEKQKRLREIQDEITHESDKLVSLQTECQTVWGRLNDKKRTITVPNQKKRTSAATRETLKMEQVILDLILGADLDWEEDERLRGIVERLKDKF